MNRMEALVELTKSISRICTDKESAKKALTQIAQSVSYYKIIPCEDNTEKEKNNAD